MKYLHIQPSRVSKSYFQVQAYDKINIQLYAETIERQENKLKTHEC